MSLPMQQKSRLAMIANRLSEWAHQDLNLGPLRYQAKITLC